jgi:hypothetical protein
MVATEKTNHVVGTSSSKLDRPNEIDTGKLTRICPGRNQSAPCVYFERRNPLTFDSKEKRKLGGNDLDCEPRDESVNCWGWDEFDQPAESQYAEEKNDGALQRRSSRGYLGDK